jgi:hypothetical protein
MDDNEDKEMLRYTFLSFLNLRARFEANEVILNSLLHTIIEHAPELMVPLKERISGIAELKDIQLKNSYTSGEPEIFNAHIKQCLLLFQLIEDGSQFIDKKIRVEDKGT